MYIVEGFGVGYSSDKDAAKLKLSTLKAMTHELWAKGKVLYLKQAPIEQEGEWVDQTMISITKEKYDALKVKPHTLKIITKEEYNAELEATLAQVREFIAGKTQIRIDWNYNDVRDSGFTELVLKEIAKSESIVEVDLSFSKADNLISALGALEGLPITKLSIGGNSLLSSSPKLIEALKLFEATLSDLGLFKCSLGHTLPEVLKGLQGFKALQKISLNDNQPNYDDYYTQKDAMELFNKDVAEELSKMPGIEVHASKEIAELAGAKKVGGILSSYKIPVAAEAADSVHEAVAGLAVSAQDPTTDANTVEALGGEGIILTEDALG